MLDRCLGPRRVRQIQRACRQGTVTFLCLFLTVIVLRGTIGAGKFGTPEKDFNEIRDHLYLPGRRVEPHRVLVEAQPENTESDQSNNYATFDISKILKDEEGDDDKRDANTPDSIGPNIFDWDEQRAEWLKNNPDYPKFIAPNMPKWLDFGRNFH